MGISVLEHPHPDVALVDGERATVGLIKGILFYIFSERSPADHMPESEHPAINFRQPR
jgi:hypothetical protein